MLGTILPMTLNRLARAHAFSRDVWLLSLATGLLAGAHLGMMQLLKVLYVLRLGYGPEFVGTLFAAGALSFSLCSVPGGILGGRFGPRRVMLAGAATTVVGMAILPLVEVAPLALRPLWPALVQVIASAGWAVMIVNQVAALMVFATAENRKGAYALKEALAGLGTFLGTLTAGMLPAAFAGPLGLALEGPAPYRYALCVSAAVGATALVPLMLLAEVPGVPRSPARASAATALLPLAVLMACAVLNHGAVASCRAFAYAYMDTTLRLPTWLIGAITSVGMFLAIPGALASPRLARRGGSGHAMLAASFGLVLSLLLMASLEHWAAAGVGVMGVYVVSAVWIPAYQVVQMEMVAPERRSVVAGAASMATSLGFGAMSLAGGYVAAAFGYQRVFLVGVAWAGLGGLLMGGLLAGRRSGRRGPREPSVMGRASPSGPGS